MSIRVVLVYLALPLILAVAYACMWPTVSARMGWFITLGSLSGELIALGTLFWVAQPLIGIGISGARPGQPASGSRK